MSFPLQAEKSGTVVHTQVIAADGGGGIVEEGDDRDDVLGVRQSLIMPHNIQFSKGDVVAVRHARKRERWGFFLALLTKDQVVKQRSSDIVFLDGATDSHGLRIRPQMTYFSFAKEIGTCIIIHTP